MRGRKSEEKECEGGGERTSKERRPVRKTIRVASERVAREKASERDNE